MPAGAADREASAPLQKRHGGLLPMDTPGLPSSVNEQVDDSKQQLKDIKVVREDVPESGGPKRQLTTAIEPANGEQNELVIDEPVISEEALARAERAKEALDRWGIFGAEGRDKDGKGGNGESEFSVEDDTKEKEAEERANGKKRGIVRTLLVLLSAALLAAGIILQVFPESPEKLVSFRWCYFVALIFPAYLFSSWLVYYAIHVIETMFFTEFLAHLDSLKKAFRRSIFLALVLILHQCMFHWGFCRGMYAATCTDPTYKQSARVVMNVILCFFVGTIATLLAATATKLLSTHFYKSTHFKKLQAALDKEYMLKVLSKPRQHERNKFTMKKKGKTAEGVSGFREEKDGSVAGDAADGGSSVAPSASEHHQTTPKKSRLGQTAPPKETGLMRHSSQDSVDMTVTDSQAPSLTGSPTPSIILDDEQEFQLNEMKNLNLEAVPSGVYDVDDLVLDTMTEEEMERLRTTVVIKTYSNLINQHKYRSPEEMKEQIKDVQVFAKALYRNIRGQDKTKPFITLSDFRDFYSDDRAGKTQALASFNLFALNPREHITKEKVVDSVLEIFKERSNIAASLSNTESMMDSLHAGLAGALHFLFIGFYLVIWNVDVVQGFSTFSATVLALSFVFGNSIRNTFESMLFLFVQHPYDVGDRIEIDGVLFTVVKISLLYTYFTEASGKHITVSNPSISQKAITNLSRTPTHLEFVNIPVDMAVAADIRDTLMERLMEHREKHLADLDREVLGVNFTAMLDHMKINLFVVWNYLMPPDDFLRKRLCRDKVLAVIQSVLMEYKQKGAIYSYSHQFEGTRADTITNSIGDNEYAAAASAVALGQSHKVL